MIELTFITPKKDRGIHLSPCVRDKYDGHAPSPNGPVVDIKKHQIEHLLDPLAKQSKVGLTNFNGRKVVGDGVIWVEVLCKHQTTGKVKSYFKSTKNPGKRVSDEPPTGGSHVVFFEIVIFRSTRNDVDCPHKINFEGRY